MSFQENQSDSGDGFDGDGEAIGSVISPQHSLQHAPTRHEPHKLSTGPAGIKSDSTRNTQVTTTAGITPSVPVKPTEYIPGNENGPILIDTLSGRNELVNVSNINREVPNLFPIIGVPKGIPAGIAIPPAVPLDLPTLGGNKNQKRLQVEKFQQQSMTFRRQPATSTNQSVPLQQQFISHDRSDLPLELSDPQSIIHISSQFYHAGDYGMMIKSLEVLDRHLVLSEEIEMAREFGQGLAHFKKYQCNIAKKFFNNLLEISVKHQSAGDHALASIYLGEIELYYDNHEIAVKHFTVAVSEYQIDNVAKLFEITVMSKSAVLVKKGSCHRALSQIREAISAFKMAKQDAELHQYNSTGEMLKEAKQDEMGAVAALGNILQSVGDYEQSYECYSDSLKLAKELGDRVSEGWAHGNLGNALLGLDRNDKALDHLTIAYNMSAKYECHPLAVGRAVSNLGNAYQSMGSLRKAKEYYEIALGHAIYGSDQQGQSRACGNIGNIYMAMKEPVKAVHYYTEALRLSSDRSTKTTGYHNRGCARFEVAECIMQGKKPKELVRSSTRDSVYRTLTIKLTDEVITTHPVQETSLDYSAHSVSESEEMIEQVVATPSPVSGKSLDIGTSEEVTRLTEALPFYETAKADLIEAVEAHERGTQNVKGSHESLNLSTLLFENNSKSFYKLQETSVETGRVHLRLSELGIMDSESQEFKQALVFAEQARARTLGELMLQKKRASCSDLLAVSTPLGLCDIFKTVEKQKMPAVFLSYCLSKLLMWVLIPINGEVKMRCNTIQLRNEEFDNSSFELYIRYNLLQFLNQNEVHIFQRCAYEQESPFTVLYDVIAKKIMEAFESLGASKVTEFIVIPDSVTHLMPFSPLINKQNWEFLGDRFRIRIVPSFLTQLIMSVTGNPIVEVPGDKSDFVVVGNPNIPPFELDSVQWNLGRLPYAEKEAVSVANIVGTTAVLREQATKQSVLYRLRSGKIIHLATHGSAIAGFLAFASSFPVPKSGIVNSEHILIFPKEIETLNISPALVVLSSCDSGRGQVKAEGVIGMARAFLSAGAQSVLVSLWRVPDESAHIFMQYFYQFLVNGLPSFHALQRSMQSLRCFHKYSHFVHWSGFQIIGKEITLHKSSNSQFPILKMIGEASIFPRQSVKEIGEGLLSGKTKSLSNVQLLVGTPGNEPEECARDFVKTYYQYYPCGVYWYNVSDELTLETCVKVAMETPLGGGIYREQKESFDKLPDISTPTLQTLKNNEPASREEKKLIVLHDFVSLDTCGYVMNQLQETSTDIIIVSYDFLFKNNIVTEVEKHLSRGCNLIDVTNLHTINIKQRMVYALLEKDTFSVRDSDHVVFTLLSEYSRGSATIIHLLTSLMKNSDDSRTGFNLVKQQLKLHIGHKKYLEASQNSKSSVSRSQHSTIHMFINDLIRSDHFSLPAQHLLYCLAIVGSLPLPQFFINELDSVITTAVTTKEDKRMQRLHGFVSKSLVEQLVRGGCIRMFPYPITYHKEFDPETMHKSLQLLFIPKLICSSIESEMDAADKAVCIMCLLHALENILTDQSTVRINMVHLHYLLVLCNKLFDVCVAHHPTLGDSFVIECVKLQLRLVYRISDINI
ncbi:tetratricopeptide repeat protein 28-like [Dysidea avara]|uniref:tetratricopeptide repeat protein 28-like n=1 Tax=Dysidea avara TaxID=196820 RepID=UPI003321636F